MRIARREHESKVVLHAAQKEIAARRHKLGEELKVTSQEWNRATNQYA